MKTSQYQERFYRRWTCGRHLCSEQIIVKETDLQILTDKPLDKDFAIKRILFYRHKIEEYIGLKDKRFLTALEPLGVDDSAHIIIREMVKQSRKAGVGPMAAVAGAIAQFVGKDLLKQGYHEVVIENGGDIFLKIEKPLTIGLYSGSGALLNRLSLRIQPENTPLGVCSSSGKIGHSLNFGNTDCTVILSRYAALADAAATAVSNRVKTRDDLEPALFFARSIKGVNGAVIVYNNILASWGDVEFVRGK